MGSWAAGMVRSCDRRAFRARSGPQRRRLLENSSGLGGLTCITCCSRDQSGATGLGPFAVAKSGKRWSAMGKFRTVARVSVHSGRKEMVRGRFGPVPGIRNLRGGREGATGLLRV